MLGKKEKGKKKIFLVSLSLYSLELHAHVPSADRGR